MAFRELHYRWDWILKTSPERLWPLVSDTNRFNRDTGVPALQEEQGQGSSLGNARRRLQAGFLFFPIEWEEEPFEWLRPWRFGVVRRYSKGPARRIRVQVELKPEHDGGTILSYQVWAEPGSILGRALIPLALGWFAGRRFDRTFRVYDTQAAAEQPPEAVVPFSLRRSTRGTGRRLERIRRDLLLRGVQETLVDRLVSFLQRSDDLSLSAIRPYRLADAWNASRRDVLSLFLQATRGGLLEMRWRVLCPLCRGSKAAAGTLADLQKEMHCESCRIDFTAGFERQVELTFHPNPGIRSIREHQFCVGGPQMTPHIVLQQLLGSGDRRDVVPPLEPGRYRLRTLRLAGGLFLKAAEGGDTEVRVKAVSEGWPEGESVIGLAPQLRLENGTGEEQLFVLERTAWSDDSTTAAEVTALQVFRDLFSSEALRPGQEFSVGSLAVLFTDLRGSTRLYREIGDPKAFGLVMDHFEVIRRAVADHEGAVVKTIGDAVMAVFRRPLNGLLAVRQAQKELASPDSRSPLYLKAGIHYGPCIAVTLNERLDYFGSTVNLAARLQGLSTSGDATCSAAFCSDPEVSDWLERNRKELLPAPVEATLKGFEGERFEVYRIKLVDPGRSGH